MGKRYAQITGAGGDELVKRRYVSIRLLQSGMVIDQGIVDKMGGP